MEITVTGEVIELDRRGWIVIRAGRKKHKMICPWGSEAYKAALCSHRDGSPFTYTGVSW